MLKSKVELEVTTQSTSSSALQAFPYSDAIIKRPEWPNLKHSEQLQFVLFLCFLPLRWVVLVNLHLISNKGARYAFLTKIAYLQPPSFSFFSALLLFILSSILRLAWKHPAHQYKKRHRSLLTWRVRRRCWCKELVNWIRRLRRWTQIRISGIKRPMPFRIEIKTHFCYGFLMIDEHGSAGIYTPKDWEKETIASYFCVSSF